MKERRKEKRLRILDAFSISVVVPKKGMHRLKLDDLSRGGAGFQIDLDGEPKALAAALPIATGDILDLRVYVNAGLYLPLAFRVARLDSQPRRVGGEFVAGDRPKRLAAYHRFFDALESILDELREDPDSA